MHWWETIRKFSLMESPEPDDPVGGDDPTLQDPNPEGGDPPSVVGVSREVLPPELQNLPEAEVKFHLSQMVEGFRRDREKVNSLSEELAEMRGKISAPPPPPKEERPLEEEILDDPESAIVRVMEKRFGNRFASVEATASEGAFTAVASRIPGFSDYEQEVRKIIKDTGVAPTIQNITGALEMAVGRKSLEERIRNSRKVHTPETPKPDLEKPKDELPELSGLEKEIFEASDMSREEWEKNKQSDFQVEVPTS